jgi:hypothetical protein
MREENQKSPALQLKSEIYNLCHGHDKDCELFTMAANGLLRKNT